MSETLVVKKIVESLEKQGFEIILDYPPVEFTWHPDIYAKKRNEYIACLVRESDTIPEVLVQRIASMKPTKKKLSILIIFCKKPKETAIRMISLYGIGVAFFHKNHLSIINKSKDFSREKKIVSKKKIKKKKKMPQIDIFISSHQIIPERKCVRDLICDIGPACKTPLNPILVEEDPRYDISQTRKCIIRNMDDSELFIGILAEEFRDDVKYEIRRAFTKCFTSSDIFIFIKVCKNRPYKLNQLINWVKKQNNVKYLEYADVKDLKSKVMRTLMLKMKGMHKKMGIPFLE